MKVYKDGVVAKADKDQLPALKKAGWTRNPKDGEEKVEVVEEETPKEETPKKTFPKKTAPNRRKPIAKKTDSEE